MSRRRLAPSLPQAPPVQAGWGCGDPGGSEQGRPSGCTLSWPQKSSRISVRPREVRDQSRLSDPIHAVVRYHSLRALASLGRMTFARLRDLLDAAKLVFASCAGVAAFAALGYLPATGFWPLLAITLLQASALASLAPLGDVLILATAAPPVNGKGPGFDYGCYAEPGRAPTSPAPSCRARLSSATASLASSGSTTACRPLDHLSGQSRVGRPGARG